jgi:hypothetical protein
MASSLQFGLTVGEQYTPPIKYSSIDNSKREIRLLLLGDNIELHSHSLDAVPPYRALSYHWGPAAPTCHVMIQGESIEIRESVREILEVLKEIYGCGVYFWVDILCINQLDLRERNSQVSMMPEIYSYASDVVSWLGPSSPGSRCAFEIIEKELYCPQNAPKRLLGDDSLIYSFVASNDDLPSTEQLEADHNLYKHFAETVAWPALSDIIRKTYWTRMWVVQEIIVAAKSVLLCGKDTTSLEKLIKVGEGWVSKSQYYTRNEKSSRFENVNHAEYQDVINTWRPIEKLLEYREQFNNGKILLMELVDSFAVKECLNVRDKVYALRALSMDASSIEVDYSKTVLEVFLSLVQGGLLISDGGRGFQSLPNLIYCMGLQHDRLSEQLAKVPMVLIPVKGRAIGSIVEVHLYMDAIPENCEYLKTRPTFIKLTRKDNQQRAEHQHVNDVDKAVRFLRLAQPNDVLCTIPTEDPILLLLRQADCQDKETIYQAIANLHNWGHSSGASDREMLEAACPAGELLVAECGNSQSPENQRFLIDSRSLSALTLWKQNWKNWYIL